MIRQYLMVPVLLLFFASSACGHLKYKDLILGKWTGKEWNVGGESSPVEQVKDIWFQFNEDGTYASQFGGLLQEGTYRVEFDKLYTHAKGESEIVVRIADLSENEFIIEMNRVAYRKNWY